jgi:hypothetical protein
VQASLIRSKEKRPVALHAARAALAVAPLALGVLPSVLLCKCKVRYKMNVLKTHATALVRQT